MVDTQHHRCPRREGARPAAPCPAVRLLCALLWLAPQIGGGGANAMAAEPPARAGSGPAAKAAPAHAANAGSADKGEAAPKDGDAATPATKRPTIAVLYFDVQASDPSLVVLRKGLAQMLVTDLIDPERWTLVERTRLEAVMAEHKLQATSKMDRATMAKVGKLLGARWLVLGSVVAMAGSARLDAHLVDVETGALLGASKASGKDDDFFGIEGQLAEQLRLLLQARAAAVPEPAPSRDDADQSTRSRVARARRLRRPAKLSIATAQRYAMALDRSDRGDTKGARKDLEAVVAEAPEFELAYVDLQAMAR